MNTGAPHLPPCRQLMTPEPNSPPMMNAAFLSDGITTTHLALFQIRSGIPPSGAFRISETAAPASASRFTSSFDSVAKAVEAISTAVTHNPPVLSAFIGHFLPRSPKGQTQRARHAPGAETGGFFC